MNDHYGGSYVHKPMVKFLGRRKFFVLFCFVLLFACKFLKILMVSDKTVHKAFEIQKTLC